MDGLHALLHRIEIGLHDQRRLGVGGPGGLQELRYPAAGAHLPDDHIDGMLLEQLQSGRAVGGLENRMAQVVEEAAHVRPQRTILIQNQQVAHAALANDSPSGELFKTAIPIIMGQDISDDSG
jgi:hypothetical protein